MKCLLCQSEIQEFLSYGIPTKVGKCPECGAKPRHRELAWFFIEKINLPDGFKALEVGPSKVSTRKFLKLPKFSNGKYTAIDIRSLKHHESIALPHRFMNMDATKMSFSDSCFDIIFCNHVLPFIRSDYQAIAEIHRCLKADGIAILNTSIELEKTLRSEQARELYPEKYSKEFLAENGTEWIYGDDFFERIEAAGFFYERVRIDQMLPIEKIEENKMRPQGELFLCFKFQEAKTKFLEKLYG
ncbi:MAG: class I SAM-dependent methyltransferase [Oligoflexia bacterium]|nr:class I SAM-dependent methyltransferase [Oligoflexia bacterium]